jgi:hypothetical protein
MTEDDARSRLETMVGDGAKFLDRLPAGWFVLDIYPNEEEGLDWSALVTDADPDGDDLAWSLRDRSNDNTFVRIPGRHETWEDACDAFEAMIAPRH